MSKHYVLMRDVITQYHPQFRKSTALCEYGLTNPHIFNVERLVEECMAAVGPYEFIDGDHADFSDGSDCKTASIRLKVAGTSINSFTGEISGVETAGGGRKAGALRAVIYNPHKDKLMYYFLPKRVWANHITIHPTSGAGKVMFSYNKKHDDIVKFTGHECSSFRQLALAI
jgi:hypothetical protein